MKHDEDPQDRDAIALVEIVLLVLFLMIVLKIAGHTGEGP